MATTGKTADATVQHTGEIRDRLKDLSKRARDEITRVQEPRAQALLETTAEVLDGLVVAYKDYAEGSEPAWKR